MFDDLCYFWFLTEWQNKMGMLYVKIVRMTSKVNGIRNENKRDNAKEFKFTLEYGLVISLLLKLKRRN